LTGRFKQTNAPRESNEAALLQRQSQGSVSKPVDPFLFLPIDAVGWAIGQSIPVDLDTSYDLTVTKH
jgi:hypothetical protein